MRDDRAVKQMWSKMNPGPASSPTALKKTMRGKTWRNVTERLPFDPETFSKDGCGNGCQNLDLTRQVMLCFRDLRNTIFSEPGIAPFALGAR
jgi:hypothetical protein